MTSAANMAVREKRRGASQQDIDQMEVRKAMTAAEYSRRQFVLNFAASKDIQLLIPGKKADAIKEAEEWTVVWLAQNQLTTVSNDFFKYTVDSRLWSKLVGDEIPFPFAFMKCPNNPSDGENRSRAPTPKGDALLKNHAVEITSNTASAPNLPTSKQVKRQSLQRSESDNETISRRHTDVKNAKTTEIPLDKARSLSLDSVDEDLKVPKKSSNRFLLRLSRSWSRRVSS
ncbi:hypothetical protein SMACR_00544 [Sordaria macrospora]|uniref:WGS project CABT00000000 data, contig 2.1 n=2 Tax=Sordaria macrospora TaxID=5147 RepID=F7VLF2_SORMK|nr:uncharacterized protein SMAC_00544 [Sordaria macrospora k-hell]KAA8635450.1 hypothetical protein SMACR_00544 [Sordaria macrospora]KAH7627485.1 hypothetical protein B0T09DRAFT_184694 [Sordaria sp. MPI-SDFR-AT-0083]WPJ59296.1 hypothetical protein SMAC4_00544 [Sordaria macrospora]CCC06329.1 unnamed protein product [Sordaria macrospora k-hell]